MTEQEKLIDVLLRGLARAGLIRVRHWNVGEGPVPDETLQKGSALLNRHGFGVAPDLEDEEDLSDEEQVPETAKARSKAPPKRKPAAGTERTRRKAPPKAPPKAEDDTL